MNISKSKYMKGLQCHKLLWTVCHAPERLPEADASAQALFDEGNAVGELAQSLFPGGVLVERNGGGGDMLRQTQALLAERRPIFEATFAAGGVYAQADILNPTGDGRWDVIEVKMSTGVKPQHIQDVALQRHCYEGAGVPVRNCYLMHINNQYVRQGALDARTLLAVEDVSDQVAAELPAVAGRVADQRRVLEQRECPTVAMGPHCTCPYPCPLIGQCQAAVAGQAPAAPPAGEMTHNPQAIRNFLEPLVYPLYLLDFETFMRAIPQFEGAWPYQQMPFQFSLHVVERLDAEPVHHSWLWDGAGDPRAIMLATLSRMIGDRGSVLAYFKSFEESRLNESAAAVPKYADWVRNLMPRMVDLIVPFRSRAVRHPAQHGSNSLKAVLPALTGAGYEDLEIQDGGTASADFVRVTYGAAADEERAQVRRNLEAYCGRDTIAMLHLLRKLTTLAE